MSDHRFDPSSALDLDLIAQLVDNSSLGSVEAFEAQNDVPVEQAMVLRNRLNRDTPDRCWDNLPESIHVLVPLTEDVFPEFDGSYTRDASSWATDQLIIAVNKDDQSRVLDPPAFLLPSGPHRERWKVYAASRVGRAYRCVLRWPPKSPASPQRWTVEVAVRWELADPQKAATERFTRLSPDLVGRVAKLLGYGSDNAPDSVGKEALFEHAIIQELQSIGIVADCAVRIIWSDEAVESAVDPAPQPTPSSPLPPVPQPLPGVPTPEIAEYGNWARRFIHRFAFNLRETLGLDSADDLDATLVGYAISLHEEGSILRAGLQHRFVMLIMQTLETASFTGGQVRDFAYVLELLTESMRIAGAQAEEALDIVRSAVLQISGKLLEPLIFVASDGLRRGTLDLNVLKILVVLIRALPTTGDHRSDWAMELRSPSAGLSAWGGTVHNDMDARRMERFEFDDLFA